MAEVHAEDKRHQRIIQNLVNNLILKGCPPERISISGIQNPDIEKWAIRKGIIFDKTQKVDLLCPEGYEE